MVKKKKSKSRIKGVKRSFAKNKPTNLASHLGMIERLVRPKEKEVRVKTFIVERPVYISSDKKFPARGYDNVYDAKESKYNKSRNEIDESKFKKDEYSDFEEKGAEEQTYRSKRRAQRNREEVEEPIEEDYVEGEEFTEEEYSEDQEPIDELPEEDIQKEPQGHFRSRGLFTNVWWKKALLWGAVWWIGIFVFTFLLQVLGLIIIDLSRDWLFLFIVIEVFSLVYQKFFSGKLKI
ncbi:MAG TPA: hypothetical protein PKK60_02210 [archaeon]|nr:hypothetical protein [archaeon]